MDLTALDKSLERQVISPVYLFHGEETYLRDRYLDRFMALVPKEVRDFNVDIVDGRHVSLETVVNAASTLPFMAERRLVIVKNADYFGARRKGRNSNGEEPVDTAETGDNAEKPGNIPGGEAALMRYLEDPPVSACLIFCADTVDRKRRMYKAIEKKGQVVEFTLLKGRDLNRWIERRAGNLGKMIEPAAVAGLVTAVGNDLQQLNTELEKLACYAQSEKITGADVAYMVSKTAELSIFELVDAIGERKYQKAIRMAREMVFLGQPVIRILYMIARQFRLLIQARSLLDSGSADKQAAGELQLHPYVAQKCVRQAKNFTLAELKAALEKILLADADIKGGRQEAMLALELLIIGLSEK